MPKKGEKLSEEHKAAMRAGRSKNKNPETNNTDQGVNTQNQAPVPQDHPATDPNVAELMRQIEELKQQMAVNHAFVQGQASVGGSSQVSNGRLVGTTEKYSVDKSRYPDPRARLAAEPRLARIAFPLNYELDWEVGITSYETRDGVNMKEPKFKLALNRIILDDMGEPTNGRYGICQMVFFEDPATAIVVANQNGLKVDDENETEFLNEMRYLRVRDWLLECFWPSPIQATQKNRREMVIDGRQVEYFEVNTENGSTSIPFSELGESKLRV